MFGFGLGRVVILFRGIVCSCDLQVGLGRNEAVEPYVKLVVLFV
jgi:hypothetical protein